MNIEVSGNSVFVMHEGLMIKAAGVTGNAPSSAPGTVELEGMTPRKHVLWGTTDDFPQLLKKDLVADTVLKPAIRLKSEMYYAGGLIYGEYKYDNGEKNWQYVYNQDIEDFFEANAIERQYYQLFYDLCTFQIAFPQMVLSLDGKRITTLNTDFTRAPHCRLGKLDGTGKYEKVFLNADHGTNNYKQDESKELKCAPIIGTLDWIKANVNKGESFVLPISITDGFSQYYPEPDWNTARNSKWVEISRDIAIFNKSLIGNKLTILYHIEVHPKFWPATFGTTAWEAMTNEQRIGKIKEWAGKMANTLKGAENVGNVLTTEMGVANGFDDKTYELLKITKVDREIDFKEGAYLPTSKEASEHKIFSMGLHSDITGVTPGGGMGAGSGSNNRVAFNQRAMLAKAIQDMAVYPLNIIKRFNGWPSNVKFTFETSLITTLDQGAETAKQSPSGGNNA